MLSKGKELLDVEIIDLRNQRFALTSKIKSSDYKLPFTKIIYNSNGIINIKKFTEEKNGSFKSYIENKNYDSTELKEILKNVFDKNFSNKKLFVSCTICKILQNDIELTTEAMVQPPKNIVRLYKRILEEEGKELFLNNVSVSAEGRLYKVEYENTAIILYEDENFYKDETIKNLIIFINTSLNYTPQREYMKNYIKNMSK
jgi:hypothetical protein